MRDAIEGADVVCYKADREAFLLDRPMAG